MEKIDAPLSRKGEGLADRKAGCSPVAGRSAEKETGMTLQDAIRKARFGRQDWVSWRDKEGVRQFARKNYESVKDAMLATGTQGSWQMIEAGSGNLYLMRWWQGVNVLNYLKRGIE